MIDVIITCRNYARFLERAIKSCLDQVLPCNIIVVNHGSTDETAAVCAKWESAITVVVLTSGGGLAYAANRGIMLGNNPYVCRLDADDWLHPDFCIVMEAYLDRYSKLGAVYSDYVLVREDGREEVVTQSDPPFGSCAVMTREIFEASGGYDEGLEFQEDYDLWRRFTTHQRFHVKLPLWYYRQHESQMSKSWNERQRARHHIKDKYGGGTKILAVIPARGNSKGIPRKNMRLLGGVSLVVRAIRMAKECKRDMVIAVSTENADIAHLARREGVEVIERPTALSEDDVSTIGPVKHAMEHMDAHGWHADIVVSIQATDPFTPPEALAEALDSVIDGAAAAVSVAEVMGTHPYRAFHLTENKRLTPYFAEKAEKYLQRQDRPPAYGFTGGFYVRERALLEQWTGKGYALGDNYRGVIVPPEAAVDIDTMLDLWLAETILAHKEELECTSLQR